MGKGIGVNEWLENKRRDGQVRKKDEERWSICKVR